MYIIERHLGSFFVNNGPTKCIKNKKKSCYKKVQNPILVLLVIKSLTLIIKSPIYGTYYTC